MSYGRHYINNSHLCPPGWNDIMATAILISNKGQEWFINCLFRPQLREKFFIIQNIVTVQKNCSEKSTNELAIIID